MGLMPASQPQPIDATPPEAVVEFGPSRPPRPRWSGAAVARGLLADRRVVPLSAVLAAVAFFGSIVSEWQVTTVDQAYSLTGHGKLSLPTGAADLGAFGTGLLIGIFLLVITVVLTMFGPRAGRRYASLVGLSAGGTLLGLLLALSFSLGSDSRTVPRTFIDVDSNDIQVAYGRGLWCAIAGTLLAMLALYLAGRVAPPFPGEEAEAEDPPAVWSWRGPRETEQPMVEEPLELTVSPVQPFSPSTDDRGKPNGSGRRGISG
jgi:hypothetical protein